MAGDEKPFFMLTMGKEIPVDDVAQMSDIIDYDLICTFILRVPAGIK